MGVLTWGIPLPSRLPNAVKSLHIHPVPMGEGERTGLEGLMRSEWAKKANRGSILYTVDQITIGQVDSMYDDTKMFPGIH